MLPRTIFRGCEGGLYCSNEETKTAKEYAYIPGDDDVQLES